MAHVDIQYIIIKFQYIAYIKKKGLVNGFSDIVGNYKKANYFSNVSEHCLIIIFKVYSVLKLRGDAGNEGNGETLNFLQIFQCTPLNSPDFAI